MKKRIFFKSFTGHSNDIVKLEFIETDSDAATNQLYFVSSAENDRIVNVWQIGGESDKTDVNTPYISFLLNDNPVYIDVSKGLDAVSWKIPNAKGVAMVLLTMV